MNSSSRSGSSRSGSSRSGMLLGSTARTYNVFRRKFAAHEGLEDFDDDQFLPKDLLTDEKISSFLRDQAEETEFKPHNLKMIRSALQTDFIPYCIPPFENKTAWPLTTIEMKKWNTHLKEYPYFPQSAEPLSKEAVKYLFSLTLPDPNENVILLQEKTYLSWSCYAAMRVADIYEIRSAALSVLKPEKGLPRRYRTVLPTTKNDPAGTGPVADRECYVPCFCLDSYKTSGEKRSFTMRLKANPNIPCEFLHCPFGHIQQYLKLCPCPFGALGKDLRFMRALTTQGAKAFTMGNMGDKKIAKMINHLNDLLPDDLKVERVSGHSGRHTAASIAVNSGVDSNVIAKVTHHKDPRALSLYQHQDPSVRLSTALAISKAVSEADRDEDKDFNIVEEDEDNAFMDAWRVGQRRVRSFSDEDFDEVDSTKQKKAKVNNFFIYK